jgi:hypothetical protein
LERLAFPEYQEKIANPLIQRLQEFPVEAMRAHTRDFAILV